MNVLRDSREWMGESREEYLRKTKTGDAAQVPAAEKLLNKIEADVSREMFTWQNSVVGAFPDVPAFLANDPECMRRRVQTEDERSPLRVWVDVSSSCSITHAELLPRGIAALALTMQLVRSGRAVELWTFTSLHGVQGGQSVICAKMPTMPVDMATIAYCLTSQGFSRGVCYGMARQVNRFNGGWSKNYLKEGTLVQRVAAARRTLQGLVADQDIILPAPHYNDRNDQGDAGLIFRDPVAWVVKTCKAAEGIDEE